VWYKQLMMNTLTSLLSIVLLATSVVAQDSPIPQELPQELRQTRDAVRRRVEQPIPPKLPLPRPAQWGDNDGLLNRLRANRQTVAIGGAVNAGSIESRIAALEAKVEALQSELEAQRVLIKLLQELLDRQRK
jgi:hypothetical protein